MVHRVFYNSKHLLICLKGKFSARNWSLFLVTFEDYIWFIIPLYNVI